MDFDLKFHHVLMRGAIKQLCLEDWFEAVRGAV